MLCESAIDTISSSALHPVNRSCLSTAGTRHIPLWLTTPFDLGMDVHCGYDADAAGDVMARATQGRFPQAKRLCTGKKDWNDVLKAS
jgi:hypothetical protein